MNSSNKIDWVCIIALMPFRECDTVSNSGKITHRPINYVYLGFSLFLMVLLPFLTWKGINNLSDIADLELSVFAPLTAMWGLGLPIQYFGKKSSSQQQFGLIIPKAFSYSPHEAHECRSEHSECNNIVILFQLNLYQNNYIQNTIVFFPSSPQFVSNSTQEAILMKNKRGPKEKPRIEIGDNPLNDIVRGELDSVLHSLGYNLRAVDGAAIIKILKRQRKRFLRNDYEKRSLCAWLLNMYKDHFGSDVKIDSMLHSSPTRKRIRKIAELFNLTDADINDIISN